MTTKTATLSIRQLDAFTVGFFAGSAHAGLFDSCSLLRGMEGVEIETGETAYGLAARLLDMDNACGALLHEADRDQKSPLDLTPNQVFASICGRNYCNISPLNHHLGTTFNIDRLEDNDTLFLIIGAKAGVRHQEEPIRAATLHPVMEWNEKEHRKFIPGLDLWGAAAKLMDNTDPTVEELMNAIG